ncbi:hypothetical protein SJ05684_c30210 [Sinorhizobium sojae CCBAU 05684]|uniref:Uncharacterized protein n=1 Tax=Sinorhizobium sojae CCBAU 05684 TaxID=716928 RepID=A0A249PFA4_9HYPH|nr:hypothetical protein [Sinorhizobium sojae]ASY64445.1 hypothetical protein SJ05684_c30210 [Sinorhizobium sojae CCBAU 05684]
MNAQLHIAGSFQDMRRAIDEADRELIENSDKRRHSKSLQRLGRVLMSELAAIIATDGAYDGYLYEADGIATDIAHCYSDLIEQQEAAEPNHAPDQDGNGTHNHRQQFGGGL